jgi:uncharacterized membrane protein affecting hemolysin expression
MHHFHHRGLLMSLIKSVRNYPQLTLCSFLIIVLGIIGAWAYWANTGQNQQEQRHRYGQLLASSGARQAVTPAMQQDLVSLQAILHDLNQYPGVIGATIHDVENRLLVQSGFKPNQAIEGKRYTFTAPVALHNTIVGTLAVTLDLPNHTERDYLFFITWLCAVFTSLVVLGWSIHRQWWSQFKDKLPSANEIVTAVVEKMPSIADIPEPEPELPKQVSVRLSLQITNMNKLYQQLNSESFANLLRRFDKQLHSVLQLYAGQRQMLTGETLLVDFISDSSYESAFRAVCTAQLLFNLAQKSPSPRLQLAAAVHELSAPVSDSKSLLRDFVVQNNNYLKPDKGEILISQALIDIELQEHIELLPDSGKLVTIKAPYQELLNKQEEQLTIIMEK